METRIPSETASGGDLPTVVAARPDLASEVGAYAPGDVIFNNYRIERAIAEGGMGRVYQATHLVTSATVALKVVRAEYARDPALRELFRREAAALRRIGNPAVVRYEGAFEDSLGQLALVMEFIEGPSLARRLLDGERLTVDEVRRLRARLAGGLAAAHAERIVHRDLSPDNVILAGGRIDDAKIIDFGIARQSVEHGATLIGGGFAGKLGYAAPEQLGLHGGEVDGRADIYALGLVLAAAATGAPLDMGGSLGAAIKARAGVPDLTAVPAPLRRELAWMLQPDPEKRAPSMDALLVDTAPHRFLPRPRSRLARAAMVTLAFTGATIAGAVGWIAAEHELGLDVAHAETRAPASIGVDLDRLVAERTRLERVEREIERDIHLAEDERRRLAEEREALRAARLASVTPAEPMPAPSPGRVTLTMPPPSAPASTVPPGPPPAPASPRPVTLPMPSAPR